MQRNKPSHRARNLIRVAVLWARGRVFRRRLITELRLFPKFLKSLIKHSNHLKAITYREQQFSFDSTLIRNFKKLSPSSMRFKIPCIGRARVDSEYDFVDDTDNNDYAEARKSFLKDYLEDEGEDNVYDHDEDDGDACDDDGKYYEVLKEMIKSGDLHHVEGEKEIDVKAECFIAQFYEEMKLQRQLSFVRHSEMLSTT